MLYKPVNYTKSPDGTRIPPNQKLKLRYQGPYQIQSRLRPDGPVYTMVDTSNGEQCIGHTGNLKPYNAPNPLLRPFEDPIPAVVKPKHLSEHIQKRILARTDRILSDALRLLPRHRIKSLINSKLKKGNASTAPTAPATTASTAPTSTPAPLNTQPPIQMTTSPMAPTPSSNDDFRQAVYLQRQRRLLFGHDV